MTWDQVAFGVFVGAGALLICRRLILYFLFEMPRHGEVMARYEKEVAAENARREADKQEPLTLREREAIRKQIKDAMID